MVAATRVTFETSDSLWGGDVVAPTWNYFLGVGRDGPVRIPVNLGGPLNVWLPFVGEKELLRAGLSGEFAAKLGIDLNFAATLGELNADLPYNVRYDIPATIQPSSVFRLDGSVVFDKNAAGFTTRSPGFAVWADLIFDLAADIKGEVGVLGNNKTFNILDFAVASQIPLFNWDTVPDDQEADFGATTEADIQISGSSDGSEATGEILGLDIATLTELIFGDFPLDPGSSITIPFGEQSVSGSKTLFERRDEDQQAKDKTEERSSTESEDNSEQGEEKLEEEKSKFPDELKPEVEGTISTGALAELTLAFPFLELQGSSNAAGVISGNGQTNPIASLNIDLDNITTRLLQSLAVPIPPFELEADFSVGLGPFKAGIEFFYNLFDADLIFDLPIAQKIDVTPDSFETRLSFFEADANGESTGEAVFLTTLIPRISVFFNENGVFQDDRVAAKLLQLAGQNARFANDVDLFVNFEEGIPGAFTGQTGSISGGVVILGTDGQWRQATTFAEETEWLARSEPFIGADPDLSSLTPRNNAQFRYVIYDQNSQVSADGVVNLASIPSDRQFALAFAPSEDGIFQARLDYVEAPIATTEFVEGTPSLDLIFPAGRDRIAVEVEHRTGAEVKNRTTLELEGRLALEALAIGLEAYAEALGLRASLGFEFGPVWGESFPLFDVEIAPLFDDVFRIADDQFNATGTGDARTNAGESGSWSFLLETEGGLDPSIIDALDDADRTIDSSTGIDTVSFALADGTDIESDPTVPNLDANLDLDRARLTSDSITANWRLISVENLFGTRGDDTLIGSNAANTVDGGEGDDSILGLRGDDELIGGFGDDILDGGLGGLIGAVDGDDTLFGGAGFDRLFVSAGRDFLDGGTSPAVGTSGLETVDLDVLDFGNLNGAVEIQLSRDLIRVSGTSATVGQRYLNFEGYAGTGNGDTMIGTGERDYFEGGPGADILIGEAIRGLSRAERLALKGDNDRLYAEGGNDTLTGGPGADLLDGGAGIDTIDYSLAPTSVFVKLDSPIELDPDLFQPLRIPAGAPDIDYTRTDGQGWRGWAQGDKLRSIENITGSDFDDILFGDFNDNRIIGDRGDDRLAGGGGTDRLFGGDGNDILWQTFPSELREGAERATVNPMPSYTASQFAFDIAPGPITITPTDLGFGPVTLGLLAGGPGNDIVLTDNGNSLVFELEVRHLVRPQANNGSFTITNYDLLLQTELQISVEGSLRTDRLDLYAATEEPVNDVFISGFRVSGTEEFTTFNPIRLFEWLSDPTVTGGPSVADDSTTERLFWDRPIRFDNTIFRRLSREDLPGIEGLSGARGRDLLEGGNDANSLYGAGGADAIGGRGGDDYIGFGEVQRALELFSFPGAPAGDVANDVDPIVSRTGSAVDAIFAAYLASSQTLEDLRDVRAAMDAYETLLTRESGIQFTRAELRDLVLLDGGLGEDTLDLRFDRGLKFLPAESTESVFVDLLGSSTSLITDGTVDYGEATWIPAPPSQFPGGSFDNDFLDQEDSTAILLRFENVIGTGNRDRIFGDDLGNLLEGEGGADSIDGRGGIDTLSFKHASEAVRLGVKADGGFYDVAGDAEGDVFDGIERILGSAHEDSLGMIFVPENFPTIFFPGTAVSPDLIDRIDGFDGDDQFAAFKAGVRYIGGRGDDFFLAGRFESRHTSIQPVSPLEGEISLIGGPGVDRVGIGTGDGTLDVQGIGFGLLTLSDQFEGRVGLKRLTDIEFVTFNDTNETLALKNVDPSLTAPDLLRLVEDPKTPFDVEISGLEDLELEGRAMVETLPQGGLLTYRPDSGGGAVAVTVGRRLTKTELGTLRFEPGQDFAVPTGAGQLQPSTPISGDTLTKEELESLTFVPGDQGVPVGTQLELSILVDGEQQIRRIPIDPRPLDGIPVGITEPTDQPGEAITIKTKAFTTPTSPIFFDGVGAPALLGRLPESRLGNAQTYEITAFAEDDLIISKIDPVTLEETVLHVGDHVMRSELADLSVRGAAGFVPAGVEISFTPDEVLEVIVTETPDIGFVFNPTIALGLSEPDGTQQGTDFRVTMTPDDGALFYRDMGGTRIAVEAGDLLDAAQIADLYFTAAPERVPSIPDGADIAARTAALNLPTVAPEAEVRRVAKPDPQDTTALAITLELEAPALPDIDGLTIDLGIANSGAVVSWESYVNVYVGAIGSAPGSPSLSVLRGIDWHQRTAAEGGAGELYAVLPAPMTYDEAQSLANGLANEAGRYSADPRDGIGIRLATIGDGAENQFVFEVANGTDGAFGGNFGPILGGLQTVDGGNPADDWIWLDGTPWEFTAWGDGEPNDANGTNENRLQISRVLISGTPGEDAIYRPTWNDTLRNVDRASVAFEARALTTEKNDLVRGRDDNVETDYMAGGGGDDIILGLGGSDRLLGEAGNDRLAGGKGDDTLTGGDGDDILVFARGGGMDIVTDFRAGGDRDLIDVSGMQLTSLAELQATVIDALEGTALTAHGTTIFLQGWFEGSSPEQTLRATDFIGLPIHLGAEMPDLSELRLFTGDTVMPDELPDLRYRADLDQNGNAGSFSVEVRDPWALPDGLQATGGADPRSAARDGRTEVSTAIRLRAENDAPRSADRSYALTRDTVLDARAPELRLTATDPEGDAFTFSLAAAAENGHAVVGGGGGFVYTPDAGFTGRDTFKFAVSDGVSTTVRQVTINVDVAPEPRRVRADTEFDGAFRLLFGFTTNDSLIGSGARDRLLGSYGDDRLDGLDNTDDLRGEDGNDRLIGGAGDDTLDGGNGFDWLQAGPGNDTLFGGADADTVEGGSGDDMIFASAGETEGDILDGGTGFNRLELDGFEGGFAVNLGAERLEYFGTLGTVRGIQHLVGTGFRDNFTGDSVTETLDGGNGDDVIRGRGGNDWLIGRAGPDFLDGEGGNDTVDGGAGDDVLLGGNQNDTLFGRAGADWLRGGAGDDSLFGGDGADTIEGNSGDDFIRVEPGEITGDVIDGGTGQDHLDGRLLSGGFVLDLLAARLEHAAQTASVVGIEEVTGTGLDDGIFGSNLAETVFGGGGDDFLRGRGGNDSLDGGAGLDILDGGDDDDILSGGAAFDRLIAGRGRDTVFGGDGDDFLRGDQQGDRLLGEAGDDRILGNGGDDFLSGGTNNDVLDGGPGNDRFFGGSGIDRIFGRDGDDTIDGGTGDDRILAGAGADILVFRAGDDVDQILDWENGIDLIDFSQHTGLNSFADVQAIAEQRGANVFIGRGTDPDIIVLRNALLTDLDAGDFVF